MSMSTLSLVLLLFGVSLASGHGFTCEERLLEERERERQVDTEIHDCRSCSEIQLDAEANCPVKGYECDASLKLTTNVLRPGDCSCSLLRCAASNATLAVDGDPVREIQCKDRTWTTSKGESAESAVCARRCGLGVCPTAFDKVEPLLLGPLSVQQPDEEHSCAWAVCQIGAAANDGSSGISFKGKSQFACSGDKTWRYTGPGDEKRQLTNVACAMKDCTALPFVPNTDLCPKKHSCYSADFVDGEGEIWKQMTCPDDSRVRLSSTAEEIFFPFCMFGQWIGNGLMDDSTGVMCIGCPDVDAVQEGTDPVKPTVSEGNKGVTCSSGKLAVQLSTEVKPIEVSTLTCSAEFVWHATGGAFTPYDSLEDAVNEGVTWKARCIEEPAPGCDTNFIQTWPAQDCQNYWANYPANPQTVTCTAPIVTSMSFTCPPGTNRQGYSVPANQHKALDSITCDEATKMWNFIIVAEGPPPLNQDEFIARAGAEPIQFACVMY